MDDFNLKYPNWRGRGPDLNGKTIYRRIMIKNKKKLKDRPVQKEGSALTSLNRRVDRF